MLFLTHLYEIPQFLSSSFLSIRSTVVYPFPYHEPFLLGESIKVFLQIKWVLLFLLTHLCKFICWLNFSFPNNLFFLKLLSFELFLLHGFPNPLHLVDAIFIIKGLIIYLITVLAIIFMPFLL
jgi:hypothetical protein